MAESKRHLMTVPYNGHRDDETCPMCRERGLTEPPTTPTPVAPATDTTGAGT